jgi:uncharacterized protein
MGRVIGFLALFLTTYGAFHLYFLIKARRAFYLQGLPYILLFIVLAFLLIAPIHSRVLETQEYHVLSMIMAWIGYIWMGALFIFVCLSIPLDLYHLIMGLVRRLVEIDLTHLTLARRQSFNLAAGATVLILLYGVFEAHYIRTETVTLHSPKIPAAIGRVRIVQISDVHIGPMMTPSRLASIAAAAKKAEPDLLVSTGDLIDGNVYDPTQATAALAGLKARLGKFAITGNHEFYAGLSEASALTGQAGFRLLRGEAVALNDYLSIVGVDDPAGRDGGAERETELLSAMAANRFTILLKHRPLIANAKAPGFDLQLSGHTHNGQIFPFGVLVRMQYPISCGLHRIATGGHLYVSRGTGTWGPPLRLLSPPEVTVIDLLPSGSAAGKTGQK